MAEEHPPRRSPDYPQIDPRKLTVLRQSKAFMTQSQLADAAGLSRATVSLLETGKRRASASTLRRLCQALDCLPGDILIEEGNQDHVTTTAPAGSE